MTVIEVATTSAPILITNDQRVMTIRLNRPEKKNALTQSMYTAMADALDQASADPAVRVVLFAGSPLTFCSGNDLQDFATLNLSGGSNPILRFMTTLTRFPKPVVAAVNGPAIGIGVTLLLHCDLVYVGNSARLQLPFVNIGLCAEYASSYLLPKMIGQVRAAELLLLGEPFTAATAEAYGIVNAVLADEQVESHAHERAVKLASQPPNALRVTKMLMKRWSNEDIDAAIALEVEHFGPMLRQPEALEAMAAFMARRKPDFSNFS